MTRVNLERNQFLAPTNEGRNRFRRDINIPMNLGNTALGSLWARRALHPCDESLGGGVAIPDLAQTEACNFETRHSTSITKPLGLGAGDWDIQLLSPPCPDMSLVYRYKASSAAPTAWSAWIQFAKDQGPILSGLSTLEKDDLSPFMPGRAPNLLIDTTAFRQAFRGITITMNSASLQNQGMVTFGQWGAKGEIGSFPPSRAVTPNAEPIEHVVLKDVPTDPDSIIIKCPEACQWNAKFGAYMAMRFVDPTHIYNPGTANQYRSGDPVKEYTFGMPLLIANHDQTPENEFDLSTSYVYDHIGVGPEFNRDVRTTSGLINQNIGLFHFVGIDATTNLTVKIRTGLEVVPDSNSIMSAFVQNTPMKDPVALDAVQGIQSKMPIGYEAKYNSLGLILPLIAQAARLVLPALGGFLMNKFLPAPVIKKKYVEEDVD